MTLSRRLVLLAGAALLGACATAPPRPPEPDALTGRMLLRVAGVNGEQPSLLNAGFTLVGDGRQGRLDLVSPIGTMVARARWSDHEAWLRTSDGEHRFRSLAVLARRMTGERLPLEALFDWLRGRPWPGAPSTPHAADEPAGFDQLGWSVDLARFADGRVSASRESPPAVSLRVQLEPPQAAGASAESADKPDPGSRRDGRGGTLGSAP